MRWPYPLPKLSTVFYSTSFTLLFTLLFILLIITPADLINQALHGRAGRQTRNIFVIAGCYTLTLLLAITIYINRMYTNRQLMEDIPKRYVPIKKGDLPGRVRRRIAESLSKGAVLMWQTRPKARDPPKPETLRGEENQAEEHQMPKLPVHPIWGEINHPGWSPPDSVDLPNVEYSAVIAELPYIIEGAVISRANRQQLSPTLASRKPYMSMAQYISYLTTLGLADARLGEIFVTEYEKCRFWLSEIRGVTEHEFRLLMKVFAALLREMDGTPSEGDARNFDDDRDQMANMRGGISADGDSSLASSITGARSGMEMSVGTFGSVIAMPSLLRDNSQQTYMYSSSRDTYSDTGEDYTDHEQRRMSGSSGAVGPSREGWGVPSGLRRVITQSTTRSESSADGSVRRGGGWRREISQPEEVEMRYLRNRMPGVVRQRTSTGTFG
ncbi:hypothetical protein BDZ91DRAFT_78754 [Kalaharituber pfeilii]|nr:hypothetical protein BDZ91DRAFT_78754 [Kalaharituber pfeilii]